MILSKVFCMCPRNYLSWYQFSTDDAAVILMNFVYYRDRWSNILSGLTGGGGGCIKNPSDVFVYASGGKTRNIVYLTALQ